MSLSNGAERFLSVFNRDDIVARVTALLTQVEVDTLRGCLRLPSVAILDPVEVDLIVVDLAIRSLQSHRAALAAQVEGTANHV